jgi:hypothetical protein
MLVQRQRSTLQGEGRMRLAPKAGQQAEPKVLPMVLAMVRRVSLQQGLLRAWTSTTPGRSTADAPGSL